MRIAFFISSRSDFYACICMYVCRISGVRLIILYSILFYFIVILTGIQYYLFIESLFINLSYIIIPIEKSMLVMG